jgi:transcriptional regulator with XRE-family HTH domain
MIAQPTPDAEEPSDTFRLYLKAHRTMRGWSQTRLAKESGMHYSQVSKLEAGTRRPTEAGVTLLANGLRLNPMQRDRLRMDAGLVPLDPASAITIKPLQELYQALQDKWLAPHAREELLLTISALVQLAAFAVRER